MTMQNALLSHVKIIRRLLARLRNQGFGRRIEYVVAVRRETASMTSRGKPHSSLWRRTLRGSDEERRVLCFLAWCVLGT